MHEITDKILIERIKNKSLIWNKLSWVFVSEKDRQRDVDSFREWRWFRGPQFIDREKGYPLILKCESRFSAN